ncbi:A-kinase anchor protein 12-like [Odontomachus brunneus]|uniref:A-kinase anchor protein 12-like n=1 Tax=Odontomachus brunneus TaxID=486640 RepID=UPI0013F1C145|nr:A-kinase anchor protein 12-like [Odontomachus brunneus]
MLSPTPPVINRPSLHPGAGYFIGPRVPQGLAAVVEGLTREVLRHRPEDIYVFAAHHFEKLLKLREQYHAEKYRNIREFDDDFRDFNLWPTKESGETRVSPTSGWPLDKEIKAFERRGKVPTDVEESPEDVSTDREKRKASRQTCTKSSSSAKRASRRSTKDKDAASDSRATKIISQMSALRGSSRTILTKDIKQELRKNKLNSGEKGKLSDSVEKGIRGERRSRTKVSKTDKNAEEEIERAATTTTGKTSARRPLKKVRRIETEFETETEREIASKDRLGNGYERTSVKGDNREAATACSRSRRSEAAAWPCEHSSERKVSSRALSMDRIRAYVLRKFASTASLEVLRSPTYVEEVQEVIDRAAPIIKEKLEEIRKPRGKRSRSVDFAWNEESFRRCVAKDSRRCGDRDEEEKGKRKSSGNGALEQEFNDARREDKSENQSARREEVASSAESEERRPGRRSAGSGRRSRRRENGEHGDLGLADRVDDDSEHSNKSEQESGAGRDTLEARLTATQSILEGISMSASELSGARKVDSAGDERDERTVPSEVSDHVNVVSLPIVRPPSSKSCRNAAKNGSDSLTLPPISPEAPRSTKKKDELSLPILPNGNQSAKKSQEQDGSKDAEEASTMRDITSDMEDIAVLPEDEEEQLATADARQDPMSDHQDLMSDARPGEEDEDIEEEALWKDTPRELAGKRISDVSLDQDLKEYRKLTEAEERRAEEVYKDSLNVTPEVADLPLRPDSLESGEEERDKLQDEDADGDVVRNQTFDDLKDRLIEIEMAERNIEKALAGQQTATCNDEAMSEAGRSTSVEKMDEARKSSGEAEKVASEIGESTSEQGTPNEERRSMNEEEKEEEESVNGVQEGSSNTERLTNERGVLSEEGESLNEEEKEGSTNEAEPSTMIGNEELTEEKGSEAQVGISINEAERVLNGVEELMVKRHMKNLESTNAQYKIKNGQTVEVSVHGVDDKDDATASNGKSVTAGASSQTTGSGNATDEQHLTVSPPTSGNGIGKTKARKRRETNEIPATTPLSLKIPFAYVLSEGSPCEIPDSVTTVIIPDRPCPSPVISEIDDRQPGLTYFPIERAAHDYVVEDVSSKDETRQNEGHAEYDMEVFGEYIHPEVTALSVDIDFVHGARGVKPGQDILVVHQDLDRIKEEGEEEEEDKEDGERKGEEESCLEKDNGDGEAVETAVGQVEEKLEDIVEHEEDETNARTIAEKFPSSCVPESEALPETTESTDLTNAGKTDVAGESRSTSDNLSEVNGSSQDVHTTTSSDAKESTASNQSIESSSIGRPIVPELNLDSLQDNTVSSFKMTANGTATKESNGSPRESDATMSLVEPLTPDERLTMGNRLMLAERELESPVEELALGSLNFRAQSDMPEADQLYPAEHAEYELLEKDLLSSEAVLEDEAREEDVIASVSREKREAEELDSEEEIARELISFLNNDTQLFVRESDRARKLEDYEKPIKSNLDVDGTSRPLSDFVHSISVDQAEKEKGDVLSEQSGKLGDEDVSKTEAVSELSDHIVDSSQENEDEDEVMVNKETENPELEVEQKEHVENNQVASLVESQQDEFSAKDNAVTNEETEEPKEVEEEEHLKSSQVTPLAKSERDESSVKDNAAINEESEEPKVEVEKKEHIKSSQATSLAESERDESSVKDNAAINEESEEPKVEVEKKEHIKSSQATSLAESERDESSVKDNAAINEESEEPKVEVEEEEHIKSSQATSLAESERDESSVKDNAAINEESEEPKVEVEEKEHIKSSQATSLAEFERDESSVKDNAAINEESEEPKVEVEEEEHIKSSQATSLAESERDESSVKDNVAINEESEEPKVEVEEEEEHIKSSQVTPLAESEQDESSTKDNAATNEETEESKVEIEGKEHIESSQVISVAESEQESSAKDNAATNEEIEEPEVEVEEKKHIETNQVAPLAEFEPDELLEKNGSHEMSDEKITDERDADIAGDQESREDKQIDESILKSQSSESASKIEEFHEKQEEDKHEEWKDKGKSEEENVMAQEECQEEELNDEGKREREESIANEKDEQEHMEVQETREDVPKTSTEESEDAGQDETPLTESITDDTAARDVTNEKEETDDLSAKLESVHGPITSAISTQDHHYARYWTMGTKSSTAETVIAAFGSNTSADEKTLDDSWEKDDFYSAVVKSQACVRGFLTRRRLRRDLGSDSVPNDIPLTRGTAIARSVFMPEDRSSLREARGGRHRLRREEALRKTTLSLENAFATGRLQHTGEFHDSVPLPLFDITHSETNSSDSLDESLAEEELTKTDTAKSSTCETANSNCHDDERRGYPRKSNAFAGHSELPIVMQLLAGASRNFRINRNSDPDLNLRGHGAKLVEPALDILMLGYPRDEATLQNRYLNFITSVEDIGSNMDYPDVATNSATNADDAQPSGEASMPGSLREPLALPGSPQGVVIEELTSLDETAGDVSSSKASTATKTSLDTNSSVPPKECTLEDKNNSEASPRTNPADKDTIISDQKSTTEEVGESGDKSAVDRNSPKIGLHAEDTSGSSSAIFHDSNGHEGEDGKT